MAQTSEGKIVHSRNLDFDHPAYLRNMTYKAKFVKDGKYAYDTVQFAAIVGVYTGFKAGAFSISENQRRLDEGQLGFTGIVRRTLTYFFPESKVPIGLIENLLLMFTGFNEISWTLKDTLD